MASTWSSMASLVPMRNEKAKEQMQRVRNEKNVKNIVKNIKFVSLKWINMDKY